MPKRKKRSVILLKSKKKKENKLKLKEKLALACFMEAVPSLIALWREKAHNVTFDVWLMDIYTENKARKE